MSKELKYVELERDVLYFRNVAPWGGELIKTAESVYTWSKAEVAKDAHTRDYSEHRDCHIMFISEVEHPRFKPYVELLDDVSGRLSEAYSKYNYFARFTKNTGYELLRYQPGYHFYRHIDVIAGCPKGGRRLLSIVFFLNDDYEGGEFAMFNYDDSVRFKIRPEAGSAILFPSNCAFPHASEDVKMGLKYSLVTWYI